MASALIILLRPLYLFARSLLRAPTRPASQGRADRDLFFDSSPFASALDSTLGSSLSLFAEARLCSTIFTLTLAS
eukprot:2329904-Pleurochrysis_carterae.AAC.1